MGSIYKVDMPAVDMPAVDMPAVDMPAVDNLCKGHFKYRTIEPSFIRF